ncbi:MAG TPA: PDZ domain-containing protein [Acidimicrobiales bacterium]|nr:PDZ domain-containing protein [Acidimicrobiales bacterium]
METTEVTAPGGRRDHISRRWIWFIAGVVIVVLAADLVGLNWTLPYFVFKPGPTASVEPLIYVPPADRHPMRGQVLLTTVLVSQARPPDMVNSWVNSDVEVVSTKALLGNTPPSQLQAVDAAQMQASEQSAEVVALRRLGYTVAAHGTGALIVAVVNGTPAATALRAGDTIVGVNGRTVDLAEDLTAALGAMKPGQAVSLSVSNVNRVVRTVNLVLASRPGSPQQPFLGVSLTTRDPTFDLPLPVRIDPGDIGGPSAGLAFTLGIMDVLTSGHMTGGLKVAATGEIELDASVADVGGVAQKTVSVREAGASVFIVPKDEVAEATAHSDGKLKIIGVSTLEDALRALQRLGGDLTGIPPVPPHAG